ncbi:MAG: tol-pal system protein YbgF [Caulobacterales bacterium 32-67-6]|nr:MAG: tol-pal system protein YbgF [Caulobacterales bacterium 32-67-6]
MVLSLSLLGPVAAPQMALAQTSMEDPLDIRDARRVERMEKVVRELRAIVFQGRDTGRPVVVQPAETDYRIEDLNRRLTDLESVITRLTGQLETTNFELRQSRDKAAALESQLAASGGSPQADFDRARGLMLSGDYDGAESAFEAFVSTHPDASLAPEANYWLGKTLVVRGADAEAAGAFIAAIRGWPTTAWAPDGVLELSRSLIALGRNPEACQALAELSRRYPSAAPSIKSRASAARTQARCG